MLGYSILGLIFVIIGFFTVVAPSAWVRLEVWQKRVFWGATLTPTARSYQYLSRIGLLMVFFGVAIVLRGYFNI